MAQPPRGALSPSPHPDENNPAFFSRFVRSSFQVMALPVLALQSGRSISAAAAPVYIFATFTGDGAEDTKLRIHTSSDARASHF